MPSISAAIGVPADRRNRLGRWSASCAEDYVRTSRLIVRKVQAEIAQALLADSFRDKLFDAAALFEAIAGFLTKRGVCAEEIGQQRIILQQLFGSRATRRPSRRASLRTPDTEGPPLGIKGGPLEEERAALQDLPLPPITELGLYVVSCSASGAGRKLHFTGSC